MLLFWLLRKNFWLLFATFWYFFGYLASPVLGDTAWRDRNLSSPRNLSLAHQLYYLIASHEELGLLALVAMRRSMAVERRGSIEINVILLTIHFLCLGSCARRIRKPFKSSRHNFSRPFKRFCRRTSSNSILTFSKVLYLYFSHVSHVTRVQNNQESSHSLIYSLAPLTRSLALSLTS